MCSFSSMPSCSRANVFGSFIEDPKQMKAVTQFPLVLVNRFESHGLFSQDFREVKQVAAPLDLAVVAHLPDRDSRLVLDLGKLGRVGTCRSAIDTSRRLSSQRLMAALPVIFLLKRSVVPLLLMEIALRGHWFCRGSMHRRVPAVLGRFPRLDPFRLNSEFDPPLRELAEAAHGQRGERRSVVGADHLGQSTVPKHPLKPGLNFLISGSRQRAAQKQISREVVTDGQRITPAAITQQKVALKVGTPTLIGGATLSKGFAIRRYSAPPLAGLHQTRSLQDFARRRIRRPFKFRPLLAQPVQNFFRAPLQALKLGLHNQRSQLLRGLIGMTVRRAPEFLQSLRPLLSITSDPLIDRRSANSIAAAKLAFAVIAAQPITHQLNPLVHGTGFLPRHRQPPPCRRNVNHVPGLFCKRCYRFVPSPALSQRERESICTTADQLGRLTSRCQARVSLTKILLCEIRDNKLAEEVRGILKSVNPLPLAALILFFMFGPAVYSQTPSSPFPEPTQLQQGPPLTNQEFVRMLYQLPAHPEQRDLLMNDIRKRGIAFPITPGLRSLVATKSGNDASLIHTLEEAERRRTNPTIATLPPEAEARELLER